MKIKSTNPTGILAIIVALSLTVGWKASAATNIVLTGDNLQQMINSAAPGDTLVLQPGTYSANVVFSNAVTVLRGIVTGTPNAPVNLAGTVTIQGNGASAFQQINFGSQVQILGTGSSIVSFVGCLFQNPFTSFGATVLSSSNTFDASVSVDLSTGSQTNLQAYDSVFNLLSVDGGNALLKRCVILSYMGGNYAGISLTGTAFEGVRLTNRYGILSLAGGEAPFTLVQSQIGTAGGGALGSVQLYNNKVWMGYNEILGALWEINCDSILIGNVVPADGNGANSLELEGGTIQAYNNIFLSNTGYGVQLVNLAAGGAILVNNTVYQASDAAGVYGVGTGFPITLRANAIVGPINGSGPSWDISYCVTDQPVSVGAPYGGCTNCNPGFVNPGYSTVSSNLQLLTNSVCIGAGPPSPIYNNRGTTNRNDVGFTGGPFYNPGNYTNTNPMVYLLTGTPLAGTELIFPQGRTNIMSINAAAAAGN